MSKKKTTTVEIDIEKVKAGFWYKLGKKLLMIPIPILFAISLAFAVFRGWTDKSQAALFANIEGTPADKFMRTLILISVLDTIGLWGINAFAKAARLQTINEFFIKYFKIALNSRVKNITQIGEERIHSVTSSASVLRANIRSEFINAMRAIIPFTIIIYNVAKVSIFAAIATFVVMAIVIILNLSGDKIFHFDTAKGKMKSDMQGLCTAQFIVMPMLKYMSAEKWAIDRLNDAQDEATPQMQNTLRQVYNFVIVMIMMIPEFIAMYVAMCIEQDIVLTLYLSYNIYSVYTMMDIIANITELKSELDGEMKVLSDLDGEDTPYDQKPAFPDKLNLKGVKFYYHSDKDHKKPFIFGNVVIEKGKKYRFVGPSGCGKSSGFRYFAGEMKTENEPDFRTLYIHQESKLIRYATIRDNITLGNKWVPDGDIISLMEDVGMGQWVKNLPKGLDSVIGVDINPSGGETSRISLLRGFVHVRNYTGDVINPRIRNTSDLILLDEVTSALDKRNEDMKDDEFCTEEKVIKIIEREFSGCTVLIISHEDETARSFGMRHIVDYKVKMSIVQNGDVEEHWFNEPIPVKEIHMNQNIYVQSTISK